MRTLRIIGLILLVAFEGSCRPKDPSFADVLKKIVTDDDLVMVGVRGAGAAVTLNDAAAKNLDAKVLKTNLEMRMRQAGLIVAADGFQTRFVELTVQGLPVEQLSGALMYSVTLSLMETVRFPAFDRFADQKATLAPIWTKAQIGILGSDNIQELDKEVATKMDEFINAYLKANPKAR